MKIKGDYELVEIIGEWIIVPKGSSANITEGIMTLSESGVVLWRALVEGSDELGLVRILQRDYEVDEETAKKDVAEFVVSLHERDLLV